MVAKLTFAWHDLDFNETFPTIVQQNESSIWKLSTPHW